MGIPTLNFFMTTRCRQGIKNVKLSKFRNKTIVIDISIYLYKFKSKGSILAHMYVMCSIFKKRGIIPIFVFDGKPPPEKIKTIAQRKNRKLQAEAKYNIIKAQMENEETALGKIRKKKQMKYLKKKFIRIKYQDIKKVKEFLRCYGIAYMTAPGEADKCCARMVCDGMADACLSDDMDLFAYGCPYILRCLDMMNEKVVVYDTQKILDILHINICTFRKLCILTGTDYSHSTHNASFNYYYQLFKKFKKTTYNDFYKWLNFKKIPIDTSVRLHKVYALFDITHFTDALSYKEETLVPARVDYQRLRQILEEENFIFPQC